MKIKLWLLSSNSRYFNLIPWDIQNFKALLVRGLERGKR